MDSSAFSDWFEMGLENGRLLEGINSYVFLDSLAAWHLCKSSGLPEYTGHSTRKRPASLQPPAAPWPTAPHSALFGDDSQASDSSFHNLFF